MIEIKQLSLPYGINNLSCHFPKGKLIGIVGANGAGKSTLLKAIAGILSPIQGEILLSQCSLSSMPLKVRSQSIAYLAQYNPVVWNLRVYDVIALGLISPLPAKQEKTAVLEIAHHFKLLEFLDRPYKQLSGGEKMRVQLARCCIKQAPLLLADEPIASLDPYYQIDVMEQLKALTPEKTCLIVIHHLPLAYRFCDEVLLLKQGELIGIGATEAVLTNENLANALGICAKISPEKREIAEIHKAK